ncbi:MAG: undecaprenyl-diphosphate phosphatase [bacterium]
MSILDALILGIVQGLTEFIPISSSAHLVIVPKLLQIDKPPLVFDVFLHFGTLLALILIYWQDILRLITACGDIFLKREFKGIEEDIYKRLAFLIILTTIPTGFMGIFFKEYVEILFKNVISVGFFLLGTGFILAIGQRKLGGKKDILNITIVDALLIGLAQGLAIAPGISRSGITIVAGLSRGVNKELSANYAFLAAIPVILAATILEAKELGECVISLHIILIGVLSAFISGYLAIKILLKIVRRGKLSIFPLYCWIVGLIVILKTY